LFCLWEVFFVWTVLPRNISLCNKWFKKNS
jgi:hypothetical protein